MGIHRNWDWRGHYYFTRVVLETGNLAGGDGGLGDNTDRIAAWNLCAPQPWLG